MNTQLRDRIAAIRFYDIVKLAKECNGGRTLGIDVNREFKGAGSTKVRFAEWCLNKFSEADLIAKLPPYETTATAYYASQNVQPRPTTATPRPQAQTTMPTATETPEQRSARVAAEVRAEHGIPEPTAPQAAHSAGDESAAAELARIIQSIAGNAVNADTVAAICKAQIDAALANMGAQPTRVIIQGADGEARQLEGVHHNRFPRLLEALQVREDNGKRIHLWLPGPAGSGKTTACQNAAKALGLAFYFTGAVLNKYELLGFRDATGNVAATAFRQAYEHGGLFLWDEVDASAPDALIALNAAIENGVCAFPDAIVPMHADFICIAAANTYGGGATHEYVGRSKLDASTVDRFAMFDWDYCEALERALAGNDLWVNRVQAVRKAVRAAGIKHVVSPRASIRGAAFLKAGFSEAEVLSMFVWKGLSAEQQRTINANL